MKVANNARSWVMGSLLLILSMHRLAGQTGNSMDGLSMDWFKALAVEPADSNVQNLARQLMSSSEELRSQAAMDLFRMKHPLALEACIFTIDDNSSILHLDHTPSVEALIQFGLPAFPRIVKLLASDSEITRLHALRVVEGITMTYFETEDAWRKWWKHIGYDYEQPPMRSHDAIERLQAWAEAL